MGILPRARVARVSVVFTIQPELRRQSASAMDKPPSDRRSRGLVERAALGLAALFSALLTI
jgi:hypothetical protein